MSNTWQALGTPHADGIPLLNKRPVWVGSLAEMSPVTTIGPAAHGVGLAPPGVEVRVAVPAPDVAVRVGVLAGAVLVAEACTVAVRVAVAVPQAAARV